MDITTVWGLTVGAGWGQAGWRWAKGENWDIATGIIRKKKGSPYF